MPIDFEVVIEAGGRVRCEALVLCLKGRHADLAALFQLRQN
jgi:hypothetical protein